MAAQKWINHRGGRRPTLQLAAGVGIALVALLPTSAAPYASAVPGPGTARFVDHGGPVLRAAQVYLLYWGNGWTATPTDTPTADQITAAFRAIVTGPYLSGLAQYQGIRPAVLRSSTVVSTSDPPSGFDDGDIAAFLDAQLDAGVVPGPDPSDQTLYIVVMPVNVSSRRDGSEFIGEHYYYTWHGQHIRFAWSADSGSLDGATRIMSHELVESLTDPDGNAILGVPGTCKQHGWCEIADICPGTSIVNGVAVSRYWSERAHGCIAPSVARATRAKLFPSEETPRQQAERERVPRENQ